MHPVERPLDLSPHIFVADPDAAVAFYEEVFNAHELFRNRLPDGRVLFVEMAFGPAKLLLSGEFPEINAVGPLSIGESPVLLMLELDDVDDAADRAQQRGADIEMPVAEMFWGERYGIVRDPFGHRWALCTRRQALEPDQIERHVPWEVNSPRPEPPRDTHDSEHAPPSGNGSFA